MSDSKSNHVGDMSFGGHLEALRPHLIRTTIFVIVLFIVVFCFKEFLVDTLLFGPMNSSFPTNRLLAYIADLVEIPELKINQHTIPLISTKMSGQFNLHLKLSMITTLAIGFPYLLWEIWRFIKPALTEEELGGCRKFVFYVSLCFFVGLGFGYFIIAPLTINFLSTYTVSANIANMIDINSYLSTVIDVSLACAILFQLPLLVYFLARMGVLTSSFMATYRRHAIVVLSVISAIITPPDVFSMVLVLLPLYLLYEYSISIAAGVERRREEDLQK